MVLFPSIILLEKLHSTNLGKMTVVRQENFVDAIGSYVWEERNEIEIKKKKSRNAGNCIGLEELISINFDVIGLIQAISDEICKP